MPPRRTTLVVTSGTFLLVWGSLLLWPPTLSDGLRTVLIGAPVLLLANWAWRTSARDLQPLVRNLAGRSEVSEADEPEEPSQPPSMVHASPLTPSLAAPLRSPPAMVERSPLVVPAAVAPGSVAPSPVTVPVRYGPGVTGALSDWVLVYQVDGVEGTIDLPAQREQIRIGRGADNDLVVNHPEVGTLNHVRIERHEAGFFVVDVGHHMNAQGARVEGSRNGTALVYPTGAHILRPRELCPWPPGVELIIPAAAVSAEHALQPVPIRVRLRLQPKRNT